MKKLKLTFRAETLRNLTTSQLAGVAGGRDSAINPDTGGCPVGPTDTCPVQGCPGPSKNVPTEYIGKIWVC